MNEGERFAVPADWLDDEAALLAATVGRWAEREVIEKRRAHPDDVDGICAAALGPLMDEVGLAELLGAGDEGAAGAGLWAAVLEQVGRADVGLGVALAGTWALGHGEMGSLAALVLPGYGGQRAGEGPPKGSKAVRAERLAQSPGLHGLRAQITATPDGDGWVLSGSDVRPLTHGSGADRLGIVCELDGAPAIFAVPAARGGIKRGPQLRQTGLSTLANADLTLRRVSAGPDELISRGAGGYRALLARLYLGCAATAGGALLAAWRILDDWADARMIKGKDQPFKENPLVGALLGDLGERIAVSRTLVYAVARRLDTADPESEATFALATASARTVIRNAMDAIDGGMELMASAGYATEWHLERYWRDVQTLSTHLLLETAGRADLARYYFGCESL